MLVLVENVLQISTTNYTLEQSTSGNPAGSTVPMQTVITSNFYCSAQNGKAVTVHITLISNPNKYS